MGDLFIISVIPPVTAVDGFREFGHFLTITFLTALYGVLITLWMKMGYKDRLVVFFTSIMILALDRLIIHILPATIYHVGRYLEDLIGPLIVYIVKFLMIAIAEGVVYKKLLTYKAIDGMNIALLINIPLAVWFFLYYEVI